MYFPVLIQKHLGTEISNLTGCWNWNLELSFSFSMDFRVLAFPLRLRLRFRLSNLSVVVFKALCNSVKRHYELKGHSSKIH